MKPTSEGSSPWCPWIQHTQPWMTCEKLVCLLKLASFFGDIEAWGCNLIVVTFNLLLQWFSMEGKWWIVCQMRLPLRSWAPHEFTSQVRHRRKFACMRAHVQFIGHNASCEQSSLGSEKERLHSIFKWMFQVHLLGISGLELKDWVPHRIEIFWCYHLSWGHHVDLLGDCLVTSKLWSQL